MIWDGFTGILTRDKSELKLTGHYTLSKTNTKISVKTSSIMI